MTPTAPCWTSCSRAPRERTLSSRTCCAPALFPARSPSRSSACCAARAATTSGTAPSSTSSTRTASFSPGQAGGYVYHDATREYLLADWQATPEKKAKFAELNEALADFYRERYDASWADERLLRQIAGPVAEASPERLGWLTAAIELAMGTSLHERAYHLMLAGQDTALDFFRDVFYDLEQAGKVTITQTLISFMRDFIRRRPTEGSEQAKQWLDYFDARIQRVFPGYDPGPPEAILAGSPAPRMPPVSCAAGRWTTSPRSTRTSWT